MHYVNGREAKNGDKVMLVTGYNAPMVGILYDATAGNDFCNGKLAVIQVNDPCPNLKECLHVDDVASVLAGAAKLDGFTFHKSDILNYLSVFKGGEAATPEEIDALLSVLNK